jgi:hypothetical protein
MFTVVNEQTRKNPHLMMTFENSPNVIVLRSSDVRKYSRSIAIDQIGVSDIYYNDVFIYQGTSSVNLLILDNPALNIVEIKAVFDDALKTTKYSNMLNRNIDNIIQIVTDVNTSLIEINESNSILPSMNLFSNNIQTPVECSYNQNGCTISRFYISNYNNGWINSKDIKVCFTVITSGGSTGGVSQGSKLLYGLVIIIVLFVFPLFIGMGYGMPKLGFILGAVMGVMSIIAMAIPSFPIIGGFIPVWIVVVLILLILIIGAIMLSKGVSGNSGG